LTSTLAWQKQMRVKNSSNVKIEYNDGPVKNDSKPSASSKASNIMIESNRFTIIYASRTHTQLAQVANELKSIQKAYSPNVTVLGSREQLCIHEKISKLKGGALNHACNSASNTRSCTYKNNLEKEKTVKGVFDIEGNNII
jgi:regulator of telomere elongation helicase 1